MSAILVELSNWTSNLPYWEQVALDQIIAGRTFTETDYKDFVQLALEDKGLAERTAPRPALRLAQLANEGKDDLAELLRLRSISNLQNVNALATGQTLPFHPALTIVYGANGAGKSGYARVLGCAGFTRGDQEVLRNINQAESQVPQSAQIEIETTDGVKIIDYKIGQDCLELRPFYVFDSTSVAIHLTKSNKLSFTPAGLSYLTRLSQTLDACGERLKQDLAPALQPHPFVPLFQGATEVARLIASLGPKTTEKELQRLAMLSEEKQGRMVMLENQIARLKSQNTSAQINGLRQQANDLRRFLQDLRKALSAFDDAVIQQCNQLIVTIHEQQRVADTLSSERFTTTFFRQTGTPVWRQFLEAAQRLATAEKSDYPSANDHCLFCHQLLNSNARDLLHQFWEFLRDESQAQLRALRGELERHGNAFTASKIPPFDEQQLAYRILQQRDASLVVGVADFLDKTRQLHERVKKALQEVSLIETFVLPDSVEAALAQIITGLEDEATALEKAMSGNASDELAALNQELLELKHCELLGQHLDNITTWLKERKRAEQAEKALGSTRHISVKYDELFKRLVTDEYIRVFEEVLRRLRCPLKVRLKTRTQKGETFKTVTLEAETAPDKATTKAEKIEKVLSEGEKRAVALADFLTEVSLDENSRGIILDDPVTSLDWEWKEVVAERLANEAQQRQVIIFTHDLRFQYLVKKHAEERGIGWAAHLIKRESETGRPGYIYPNSSPATESDHRSSQSATDCWHKARQAAQTDDQRIQLHTGFSYLRRSYEALVVYEILGSVVRRFEERVSIGRLKDVVADEEILVLIERKYDLLSGYIGGHLPCDEVAALTMMPETLKREIDEYEALLNRVRKIRKARNPQK